MYSLLQMPPEAQARIVNAPPEQPPPRGPVRVAAHAPPLDMRGLRETLHQQQQQASNATPPQYGGVDVSDAHGSAYEQRRGGDRGSGIGGYQGDQERGVSGYQNERGAGGNYQGESGSAPTYNREMRPRPIHAPFTKPATAPYAQQQQQEQEADVKCTPELGGGGGGNDRREMHHTQSGASMDSFAAAQARAPPAGIYEEQQV